MNFRFADNTLPEIKGLYQWPSYSGMMEGYPNAHMNECIRKNVVEKAKSLTHWDHVYLIEPWLDSVEFPVGDSLRVIEKLPAIACVAYLVGQAIDDRFLFSGLTLIWFQEEYALPIDDRIKEEISQLNWTGVSKDFDF